MQETTVEQIFINFSKRSIKIVDNEGYDKTVTWKWDDEGSEGFAETISGIQEVVDHDLITYTFAIK